jgi:isopenicillin-N epimerase
LHQLLIEALISKAVRSNQRGGQRMTINRRDFISTAGWSLAAGAVTSDSSARQAKLARADNYGDWSVVRDQFELAPGWVQMSQFFIVSHPRPVREAIERYRRAIDANPFLVVHYGLSPDPVPTSLAVEGNLPLRMRGAAAEYVGGQPDEIALTDSTTEGLALIYNGLTLKSSDEVLTTTHDHFVHHESIRLACERSGASWRRAPLYDAPQTASAEEMVDSLRHAIEAKTRVIGLTWVHSSTGVKVPVRALTQVVAEANRNRDAQKRIVVVLDAVHGFGNQEAELASLGCDFVAAGTHKWIFAPRGTGIIWAPASNWGLLRPTIPTMSDPDREQRTAWEESRAPAGPTHASWISPGGFKAYEHQWAMADAFEFHRRIGRTRVAERIAQLNTLCKDGLARIPKVKVLTPRDPTLSAGIICFEIEGQTQKETVTKLLARKVIASTSPYKVSYVRLAPSLVNDERDVDATLRAVREIV